jgi:hypothetical protein
MATYRVITFQCPRCKTDIGRQWGLITTKVIVCPSCGTNVRIDTSVIQQNWAFNFGWVGGILTWFVLGALVLADPQFATTIGRKTFKSDTGEQRLLIAGMCGIPAMFAGLLIGLVGGILGTIVAWGASEAPPAPATPVPTPGAPPLAPPQPQGRGCLIRSFFILLWPIVTFFASGIVVMVLTGVFTASDEEVRRQLSKEAGEKYAGWMLLASLVAFILGCVGLLPLTGRGKKKEVKPPPDAPRILSGPQNPYGL